MSVKMVIKLVFAILGTYALSALDGRAEGPIDFRSSDNLKAVYDAGFRPWRSTMLTCNVTDKNISIVLPEDAQFSLLSEVATFSVLANDQLGRVDLTGEVMSTDEAVAKINEICNNLRLPAEGLDQAIPSFEDRASKPTIWNTRGKKGNISVFITLDRLDFIDHLGAKVYVTLDWKREGIPPKFPTTPMQPPAGYEHESMAPPPPTSNPNPHQPYYSPEEYRAMIDKAKAGGTNIAPPPARVVPPSTSPVVAPVEENQFPWLAVLLVLLAAVAGVLTWLRYRRK